MRCWRMKKDSVTKQTTFTMNKIQNHINNLPIDERYEFVKDYNDLQSELKSMQLTDLYHNQAHEYRVALEREVQHTKRIFGKPLRDDVRRVLLTSLREIPIPNIDTSKYDARELMVTPKPNFVLILRNVVSQI